MTDTTGSTLIGTPSHPDNALSKYLNSRVVLRAAVAAVIIGAILTLANQSVAIFGTDELDLLPLAFVFLAPFVVVTISQLLGARQAAVDARQEMSSGTGTESFAATATGHGIAKRAVLVGMLVVGTNATIFAAASYLEQGSVRELPLPLLGQAFVLPVLFGVLSQTLSYRRAIAAFRRDKRPNPTS